MNKKQVMVSNLILLLVAIIWGFAFVAQRIGIKYVGPFTFNGVRFALGSISLLPFIRFMGSRPGVEETDKGCLKKTFLGGSIAGVFLFAAASFQQVGIVYTSAGKAAFITGLYIVFVPMFGIFIRHRIATSTWFGAIIALTGLYLLCVTEAFTVSNGDWLELVGSFFWAFHILIIDYFSKKADAVKLSCIQFAVCSVLSLGIALPFESIGVNMLLQASLPILYGGICSVGVAYTLQVFGQKNANPAHAAIILSMEALFAAVGSSLLLHETLESREVIGCILMLAGMILSQIQNFRKYDTTLSVAA